MWGWLMVGLSGLIHLSAANSDRTRLSIVSKPITLLVLLAMLIATGRDEPQFIWITLGIALSLFSDILNLFAKSTAKVSFSLLLCAFLFYSKGFWSQLQGDIAWWLPALLFAGSIIIILLLLPRLDMVIFPVSIMGMVLVQMSWAASAVWMSNATTDNLFACIACLFFVMSTLLSAVNSYRTPFKHADLWATAGYFVAQSLIVASVVA
jgi:uncharacterized membrane protein YhhN